MFVHYLCCIFIISIEFDLSLGTNRSDICGLIPDGIIDTAFASLSDSSLDLYYILKGDNFWEMTDDLRSIVDKTPQKIDDKWNLHNLKDIEISLSLNPSIFSEFGNPTYFIKDKHYYRYLNRPFMSDTVTDGLFKISDVSFAFNPKTFEEYSVIFIKQTLDNGLVKRESYVYDFEYPDDPMIVQNSSSLPPFISNIDQKLWISAIVEFSKNKGIIFVKYNGEGYHCFFDNITTSCSNENMVKNRHLFSCREVSVGTEPPFDINGLLSKNASVEESLKDFDDYSEIPYIIILSILLPICLIIFIVLPFYVYFAPIK